MDPEMKKAVVQYGRTIKRDGWNAGEAFIIEGEKRWPDFRKWAHAFGVMLRTDEILRCDP